KYCFGDDSSQLKDYAWYGRLFKGTKPVGQKKPNAWGLYDLHGNVWEWCADDWHNNYQEAPSDGSIWLGSNKNKVLRGGSWYYDALRCCCACRGRGARVDRGIDQGFRVASGFHRVT
ncbi:MAG: formylglycine-generating enzyme family protein, partial [Gloeocapsa sp. DLM2.Bin57]